jgi:hypothetical protein
MAEAAIPVDLLNPGQVFACLGLMEAAEILWGACEGRFDYRGTESSVNFVLRVDGAQDPVMETLCFLSHADAKAIVPRNSGLSSEKWDVETLPRHDTNFPCAAPDSPAALPTLLKSEQHSIPIEHWADGSDRDNMKFWEASRRGGAACRSGGHPRRMRLGLIEARVKPRGRSVMALASEAHAPRRKAGSNTQNQNSAAHPLPNPPDKGGRERHHSVWPAAYGALLLSQEDRLDHLCRCPDRHGTHPRAPAEWQRAAAQ